MDKNEVLKFYFDNRSKDNCVYLDKIIPIKKDKRVQSIFIGDKRCFLKQDSLVGDDSKLEVQSEVFCSYLYKQKGLKGATYIPVIVNGKLAVLSDDVVDKNVMSGKSFAVMTSIVDGSIFFAGGANLDILKYTDLNSGKDAIKMSICDLGVRNSDRSNSNFYVKSNVFVDGKSLSNIDLSLEQDRQRVSKMLGEDENGKIKVVIDDIKFIDNGYSACSIYYDDMDDENGFFSPILKTDFLFSTRATMIDSLKFDKKVQSFMPLEDTAKFVDSVNVFETAQEVEDIFHIDMDKFYLKQVSASFENIREKINDENNLEQ